MTSEHLRRFVFAAALLACAACTAATPQPAEDDATIGATAAALTDADPCALGATANAIADISTAETSDDYYRPAVYINTICPAHGKDRPETIMEFEVGTAHKGHSYAFSAKGDFPTPDNETDCKNLTMDAELIYYAGNHLWSAVSHQVHHGEWVGEKASDKSCYVGGANFGYFTMDLQSTRYRMRATASNGYATKYYGVTISAFHEGPRQ